MSCHLARTSRGQEMQTCTRGSSSIVSSRSIGLSVCQRIMASSPRTVRSRAPSTQSAAVSGVATVTSSRTCVHESSPAAKAVAIAGRSARRLVTEASE